MSWLCFQILVEAGTTVNATTVNGNTALHLLCKLPESSFTDINTCIELLVIYMLCICIQTIQIALGACPFNIKENELLTVWYVYR